MGQSARPLATVVSVALDSRHGFSKAPRASIELLAGLGVEGDAHCGPTVKHRSRVAADPTQPNLRQVHLIHAELLEEVAAKGFRVAPGQLGENITTSGLDLLALPVAARLHIGAQAVVEITGLRNPCAQIDSFQKGLLAAVVDRDAQGQIVRKAGVMAMVIAGGSVAAGDAIRVVRPGGPHRKLEWV